jgi:hypothetical protein
VRYFLKKEENTKKYVQLNYDYKDNEEMIEEGVVDNPIFETLKEPS